MDKKLQRGFESSQIAPEYSLAYVSVSLEDVRKRDLLARIKPIIDGSSKAS